MALLRAAGTSTLGGVTGYAAEGGCSSGSEQSHGLILFSLFAMLAMGYIPEFLWVRKLRNRDLS